MREKYVEDEFPRWFVFGVHPETGYVDVSDRDTDVVTHVSPEEAEKLIKERDRVIDTIYLLVKKLGLSLDEFHGLISQSK